MAFSHRIGKLTRSIERVGTGESLDTFIRPATSKELRLIKRTDWLFDWRSELTRKERQVFGLWAVDDPVFLHGLISLEQRPGHVFAHLIESHRVNKGRGKLYDGVLGNLVAWACHLSFKTGHYGEIVFDSKSSLREHYRVALGAVVLFGNRMYVPESKAQELVERYARSWQHGN